MSSQKNSAAEISASCKSLPLKSLKKVLTPISDFEKESVTDIDLTSLPKRKDVVGGPKEPVYDKADQADIQGNIIPGFNKGHQRILFFKFGQRKAAKRFLGAVLPHISSMEEVIDFRQAYRTRRMKLGKAKVFLSSTHLNLAFSFNGLSKLTSKKEVAKFGDTPFSLGMAERSTFLGDPSSKRSKGHASKWKFGGPDSEADLVVIVASDNENQCSELSAVVKAEADENGMELIYEQVGKTLPGALHGHEHFGFKDGISQPGIRGKLSKAPGDYITPRFFSDSDERRLYFAKPGQQLVWPGQFLLGEKRQDSEDLTEAFGAQKNFPSWAKRGSFLVIRRLSQNVPAFWSFVSDAAKQLRVDPVWFASRLVGRWPSGAPVLRSPKKDNCKLGADEFANNHFLFDDDTAPSKLKKITGYGGDKFEDANADFLATVCPHFAHIRKVNMRESVTDMGKPEDNGIRFIMRRGIPFGDPILGCKSFTKKEVSQDRGLMFLCYNSSIEEQFEFLQRRWANGPVAPNVGGFDPIIGQNGMGNRTRYIDFPLENGQKTRIKIADDFVVPTGGGYFFAPTVGTVANVLAK